MLWFSLRKLSGLPSSGHVYWQTVRGSFKIFIFIGPNVRCICLDTSIKTITVTCNARSDNIYQISGGRPGLPFRLGKNIQKILYHPDGNYSPFILPL